MTHLLVCLTSLAGFAALALATERQQEELFGRPLSPRTAGVLRSAGWVALAAALAIAVRHWGWGLALVAYSGHTSLAAGVVYVGLICSARTFARDARPDAERRQR